MGMTPKQHIKRYWQGAPAGAIDAILERMDAEGVRFGNGTSVWHEVHRYVTENAERRPCSICGGPMSLRDHEHTGGRHHLCVARAERGIATPPIESFLPCPCAKCTKGKQ